MLKYFIIMCNLLKYIKMLYIKINFQFILILIYFNLKITCLFSIIIEN